MKGEVGERVLGRYRLGQPIGEGGFGRIFLGRQVALDREVAIKASRPCRRDDDGLRERFRREALLVAGINHPSVVTYHDFGVDDDGDLVLVMEHLQGCSLLEVLRRGRPVPLVDIARWMAQAAAGLHEAHARGLVHRDVKPSNLILVAPGTRAERLKVIDFGILLADRRAHPELPELTKSDAFIGTPEYVAPEMMLGRAIDGRADQYALALVTFELIAGRRPFPSADDGGLLARLSERPAGLDFRESGRRVPPAMSAVLWRALSPSPGERFPTIAAFGDALRDAVDGFDDGVHDDKTRVDVDAALATTRTVPTRTDLDGVTSLDARSVALAADRMTGRRRKKPGTHRGVRWGVAAAAFTVLAAGIAIAVLAWQGPSGNRPQGDLDREVAQVAAGELSPERVVARQQVAVEPGAASIQQYFPSTVPSMRSIDAVGVGSASAPSIQNPTGRLPVSSGRSPAVKGLDTGDENVRATAARNPPLEPAAPAVPAAPDSTGNTTEAAGLSGVLVLNAEPWAEVVVDGQALGRTPILALKVAVGSHRIVFQHPALGTRTVTRMVAEGAKEIVKVRMQD